MVLLGSIANAKILAYAADNIAGVGTRTIETEPRTE